MIIKLDQVTKKFGKKVALSAVNFAVEKGEFVFVTGVSGSGKTTLLRMTTRDLLPTEGKVMVDGLDVVKLKSKKVHELRRKIGVVYQDFKLLKDRTVFENVSLAMRVVGSSKRKIEAQVMKTLKLVGLKGKEDLFPLQLAGGELQRVCLARAVVAAPPILLADEPTGNLDPTTAWQIMELLKRINDMGTTVLMATHNVDIVNSMAERIVQLDDGKIVSDAKKK